MRQIEPGGGRECTESAEDNAARAEQMHHTHLCASPSQSCTFLEL